MDKQSFYQSINETTVFDDDFFKKIYGYSVYDRPFLESVSRKLISLGRKDMVQAYNNWFTRWKAEDDKIRKGVASWYQEKLNMEWEQKIRKIQNRKVVGKKNGTEGRDYQFAGLPQDW